MVLVMLTALNRKTNRLGTVYYEDYEGNIVLKECTKCHEIFPLENFAKHKLGLGGKEPSCKKCKAERGKRWRESNPSYRIDYETRNQEKIYQRRRRYREANREREVERTREWRKNNSDRMKDHRRKWLENNKDKMAECVRRWKDNNPDKLKAQSHRRRARKQSLPDTFTYEQLTKTLEVFNGGCALTGDESEIHWDHVIPLATECIGTIYGNMIPLRSDLNMSKNDSNIIEWFFDNKERFNLSQEKFNFLITWLAEVNGMSCEEYINLVYECHDFNDEEGGVTNDVENQ